MFGFGKTEEPATPTETPTVGDLGLLPVEPTPEIVPDVPSAPIEPPVEMVPVVPVEEQPANPTVAEAPAEIVYRGRVVLSAREVTINDHKWIEASLSDNTTELITPADWEILAPVLV